MHSEAVIYLNSQIAEDKHTLLTRLLKRLSSNRFARMFKPAPTTDDDPYLLVLLAEQAFAAGREKQALFLVDTAYEVFDRQKNIMHLRCFSHRPRTVPRSTGISLSTV
jgi:hypothetical protein